MKRTLEPDFDTQLSELPAHSRALLARVNVKYVRAIKLANRFMQHVEDLYNNEAFYLSSDSCHMHLEAPELLFDWINVGIDKDTWVILGSNSGLVHFFNIIGQDGLIWRLISGHRAEEGESEESVKCEEEKIEAHRANLHEMLVEYFVKNSKSELVLEQGGEDGQFKGGRMGPSTNWMWQEAARSKSADEDEESSGNEEEEEASVEEESYGLWLKHAPKEEIES